MMRVGCLAALILINYVLQSTLLVRVSIIGVNPDTAIILIVSYGILRGDVEGAVFGFFSGLVHDMFGGHFIGLYAMLGMLTGYAAGKPFKDYFKDNYFLPFMIVVAATFSYQTLIYFTSFLIRGRLDFWFYITNIIMPKTIYTAAVALPLYSLMFVINSRIEDYEHNRRNLFKE